MTNTIERNYELTLGNKTMYHNLGEDVQDLLDGIIVMAGISNIPIRYGSDTDLNHVCKYTYGVSFNHGSLELSFGFNKQNQIILVWLDILLNYEDSLNKKQDCWHLDGTKLNEQNFKELINNQLIPRLIK